MKNQFLLVVLAFFQISFTSFAQTESPYKTKFKVDGPITLGGVAVSGLGLYLISNKSGLSQTEVNGLSKNNVNKFDRFSAGNYNENARKLSNIPFYGSFAVPFTLLLDKNMRSNTSQVLFLYGETLAITGSIYSMTVGSVYRKRPLVYGENTPNDKKTTKNAQNSFFAGHTAATASATFFAAKVFNDYYPDSPWRPVVWGAAAAIPASVGYLRLRAGKHFLSDNLIGYAVGSTVGILVPHLHKKSNHSGFSVLPTYNPIAGNGFAVTYAIQ
ncbi:phosphatase PAP2 family protein [Adhaeribacter swui]|uniref:Phosphatase PAP2 family protein n=1 Tax=Adhaeribacter swui TaxID=2086471 RepID=A0A7G7G7L6_9BACT|nr:phosphatase PAP2 family protein [Adhaeribacter swui]QNF33150.1 phosphatase PAP2 family protein [Adhaeribacter swui]